MNRYFGVEVALAPVESRLALLRYRAEELRRLSLVNGCHDSSLVAIEPAVAEPPFHPTSALVDHQDGRIVSPTSQVC